MLSNFVQNSTVSATFANVTVSGSGNTLAVAPSDIVPAEPMAVDFGVFPNPSTGEVTLDLSAYANVPVRLSLYDAQGKALKIWKVDTMQATAGRLDLPDWQNGVYLIRVQADDLPEAGKKVILNQHR